MARVKVWLDGEILTASDINAEFDNCLASSTTPDTLDDVSGNLVEMQAVADPYPADAASLATTMRGEIQRLRYLLKQITGETEWYIDPDTTLAALNLAGLPRAAAGGTADAITADFTPDVTLADKTMVAVVAAAANATTTPTFAPDGLTAHTITKQGGSALAAGNIAAAGHVLLLSYNLANTRWELLNPAPILPPVDPAAGTAGLRTLGTGAQQACAGNDSRLSDARACNGSGTSAACSGNSATATYATNAGNADTADGFHFRVDNASYVGICLPGVGWKTFPVL